MSKVPDGATVDEVTPVARRVLLNGLIALEAHRDAITVVGAQAVHLLTAHVPITVGTYTSDGDLGLDPALLADEPLIQKRCSKQASSGWIPTRPAFGSTTKR